jgi:N-acetylglutamate synthase-like GNAT family acetyltransferase
MLIKKFKIEDIEELIKLSIESVEYCCINDYNSKAIQYWKTILIPNIFQKIEKTPNDFLGLVASIKSEIVGCCFLDLTNQNIKGLYIKPKFLRQQIGKKLMLKIEEEAKNKGITQIFLDASINAIKFYESIGYLKGQASYCTVPEVPSIKMKKIF